MAEGKYDQSGFNKPIIEEIDRKLRQHISTLKQHIYYSDTVPTNPKESQNYESNSSSIGRKYAGYSNCMKNSSNIPGTDYSQKNEPIDGISLKESHNLDQYYQQLYRNKLPDADYEKLLRTLKNQRKIYGDETENLRSIVLQQNKRISEL